MMNENANAKNTFSYLNMMESELAQSGSTLQVLELLIFFIEELINQTDQGSILQINLKQSVKKIGYSQLLNFIKTIIRQKKWQ